MNERELRALAAWVEFPEERDLAPAVRARLQPGGPRRRRALVVVLAAALLAIAVAFAVPPARSAILRFFHLQGATIELVDKLPEVPTSRPLDLGDPLTLAEARRTMRFRPLTSSLLGAPDRISWDGHQLWYVYGRNRLLVSQLLTLYITPVYYVYIEGARSWLTRPRRVSAGELQADAREDAQEIPRRPLDRPLAADER